MPRVVCLQEDEKGGCYLVTSLLPQCPAKTGPSRLCRYPSRRCLAALGEKISLNETESGDWDSQAGTPSAGLIRAKTVSRAEKEASRRFQSSLSCSRNWTEPTTKIQVRASTTQSPPQISSISVEYAGYVFLEIMGAIFWSLHTINCCLTQTWPTTQMNGCTHFPPPSCNLRIFNVRIHYTYFKIQTLTPIKHSTFPTVIPYRISTKRSKL